MTTEKQTEGQQGMSDERMALELAHACWDDPTQRLGVGWCSEDEMVKWLRVLAAARELLAPTAKPVEIPAALVGKMPNLELRISGNCGAEAIMLAAWKDCQDAKQAGRREALTEVDERYRLAFTRYGTSWNYSYDEFTAWLDKQRDACGPGAKEEFDADDGLTDAEYADVVREHTSEDAKMHSTTTEEAPWVVKCPAGMTPALPVEPLSDDDIGREALRLMNAVDGPLRDVLRRVADAQRATVRPVKMPTVEELGAVIFQVLLTEARFNRGAELKIARAVLSRLGTQTETKGAK